MTDYPDELCSFIVPWSGEDMLPGTMPSEPNIPVVPISVPIAGPVVQFIGSGEHAIWDDVWGYIKGASSAAVDILSSAQADIANPIIGVVENYVGNQLKALSGFINQAFQYTLDLGNVINTFAVDGILSLYADVVFIDTVLGQLLDDVKGIDEYISGIVTSLIPDVIDALSQEILNGIADVQTWAIDNIYNPLLEDIAGVEARVDSAILGAVADVEGYVRDLVNQETLARLAEIAGILGAIAALQEFVDNCGEPMCDVMGPKTDLGKLLKALDAALLLAAVAELAGEDFAGIETLLTGLVGKAAEVVDFFDTYFLEGGDTLGELVGRL